MHVSIIITTYNAEKFILSTLNSILAQTYNLYEVIIIDDGSTDKTVDVINQFISNHHAEEFKLFLMQRSGRANALQFGISKAKHDWIAILDADDLWHERKLEIQVKYLKHYKIYFLAARCVVFQNENEIDTARLIDGNINSKLIKSIKLNEMLRCNKISHISVLFSKNFANYNTARKKQIDYELWLRLLSQNVPLYILDIPLAYHRVHDGQFFESSNRLIYSASATLLQLHYCIKNYKPLSAVFVITKIFYYIFVSKKMRLKFANLNLFR